MSGASWAWIGASLAGATAVFALRRARRPGIDFYSTQVYHVTGGHHARASLASAACAAAFVACALIAQSAAIPLLAVWTVGAILYFASFVRGATGEDE